MHARPHLGRPGALEGNVWTAAHWPGLESAPLLATSSHAACEHLHHQSSLSIHDPEAHVQGLHGLLLGVVTRPTGLCAHDFDYMQHMALCINILQHPGSARQPSDAAALVEVAIIGGMSLQQLLSLGTNQLLFSHVQWIQQCLHKSLRRRHGC